MLGAPQEKHRGQTGEHHRAGEAGQQPEAVGQDHPGRRRQRRPRAGQQQRPLLLHRQEGRRQQRAAYSRAHSHDQQRQGGNLDVVQRGGLSPGDAVGRQPLVQAVKELPVDVHVRHIGKGVVGVLDGLEVEDADIPLYNGPVKGVLNLLRPLVAVVCVAVLDIVPQGEYPHGVQAGFQRGVFHAGLHDVFPLDVRFDHADGSAGLFEVIQGEGPAVVEADDGLSPGDDVFGRDAVALIAAHHRLSVLGVIVAVVAEGAGDDLHPG